MYYESFKFTDILVACLVGIILSVKNNETVAHTSAPASLLDSYTTPKISSSSVQHHQLDDSTSDGTNSYSGANKTENLRSHVEALVALGSIAPGLGSTATTTTTIAPVITTRVDEANASTGICSLVTITRKSQLHDTRNVFGQKEVVEKAITCSQINQQNYHDLMKSIYKRTKLNIQQIIMTDSESLVVFGAIDLICGRFNCSKLTVLTVTGQTIREPSVLRTWIGRWPELEILDLSNTSLSAIEDIFPNSSSNNNNDQQQPRSTFRGPALQNLTMLTLDNNNIGELNFNQIFREMPNLKHLSLVNNSNKIFNITCSEHLRSRVLSQFEIISLAGNAINCDKSQLWLMKRFQSPVMNLKFPDHESIRCATPENLADMNWAHRVSVLETPICDLCECRSQKKTAISIDCHGKNLTSLPDALPLNTKVMNLTSNRINSLSLPANAKNWDNVTYLYLENNFINSFQPLEINLKFMKNLAALDIRKNKLDTFASHIFEQFINLDQVHLSNNPWLCDCDTTTPLQEWLQRQFHKVGDKEEILCGTAGSEPNGVRSSKVEQRLASKVVYRLSKIELCPKHSLVEPIHYLDVVNIILGLAIFLVLLKVTVDYMYQYRTKRLPHFFKLNY